MDDEDSLSINAKLLSQVQAQDYAGYDPFDSLNSRLFALTGLNRLRLLRLVWLQFGKRSAVNFRPLFLVPKMRNPKGVALFILGQLEDYSRTGNSHYIDEAQELADWLLTQVCDKKVWHYPCWGYHFDWQSRAFFVGKGTPNIITTCYVARALYALGKALSNEKYMTPALDSAYFIYRHLLTKESAGEFFAYVPGEKAFVHNASLWGAAWVSFCGVEQNDEALIESAVQVGQYSIQQQSADGSWPYGNRSHHQFIDGFHTGYNLEALQLLGDSIQFRLPEHSERITQSINRGIDFYRQHCFEPDGRARYFHDKLYPLDMHSFAQAIITLSKLGNSSTDPQLIDKIVLAAISHLYLPRRERFAYQKHQFHRNSIDYIRWTQAWAYYSLAVYHNYLTSN